MHIFHTSLRTYFLGSNLFGAFQLSFIYNVGHIRINLCDCFDLPPIFGKKIAWYATRSKLKGSNSRKFHLCWKKSLARCPKSKKKVSFFTYCRYFKNLLFVDVLKISFYIRYGDIFHINLGNTNIVYLCDFDTMEYVGKQDKFSFREDPYKKGNGRKAQLINWLFGFNNIHTKPGIILASGNNWQEQRRFALKNLKDLGFGKSSMEDLISDEVKELIHDLKYRIESNDQIDILQIFNLPVINSLWKIITGKRLDMKNPDEEKKMKDLAEMFATFGAFNITRLLAFKLPLWIGKNIPLIRGFRDLIQRLLTWFRSEYNEHEKTWDANNPRDFLDFYIAEHKKAKEEQKCQSSFYGEFGEANFVNTMYDLFLAGSETTSTTLTWFVLK